MVACVIALMLVLGGVSGRRARPREQRAAGAGPLETIQIRPNVVVIFGAGSNVHVHVGEDASSCRNGSAAMAAQVVAAVKAISDRPLRLIINTSADADHVGGNETVGAAGMEINPDSFTDEPRATIIAHENVLGRMSTLGGAEALFPTGAWPTETFTSRYRSMYLNEEAVQMIRQLGAHSDGDILVHFRRADVIATGDILDLRHFPVIDAAIGGSIQGELDALNRLLDLTVPAMPLVLKPRTCWCRGTAVFGLRGTGEYRQVTVIKTIEELIKKG